jgi:membrane protease YdiL (CAAX protease family)
MSDIEVDAERDPEAQPVAAPDFSAASSSSYAHTLFFDSDGLRPGWGFAFFLVAFLALQHVSSELAWSRDLGASGLWSQLIEECGNFLAVLIPSLVLARIEHRHWGAYGLPIKRAFGKLFWIGIAWGFVAISVLMLILYGFHSFVFGHIVLHGVRLARFAAFWALMFLLVGLFEEFLLRGYPQFTLARGMGFWPGAIALSCAFGLIHLRNGGENWRGVLAAAAIGLFFCLTLRRTGNLWFAVGFHASWDWGETFFYSVPDSGMTSPGHLLSSHWRGPDWLSGGPVGPEGSVFCFLVIALIWIAFARLYPSTTDSNSPALQP